MVETGRRRVERETGRKPGRMSGRQLEREGDRERQAGGEWRERQGESQVG